MVGALEPAVYDRPMSSRRREKPQSELTPNPAIGSNPAGSTRPDASRAAAAKRPKRRRRGTVEFEKRIGYRFRDPALLEQALTHISALTGARNRSGSYQRLEFLGDHVLGLVVSDMLFRAFPKADEGEMSRRLADLVRKEACADVGREIELGETIRLGASEANAGGRGRTAILADVRAPTADLCRRRLPGGPALIERLAERAMRTPARLPDLKTALQEWHRRGLLHTGVPRRQVGPDHVRIRASWSSFPTWRAPAEDARSARPSRRQRPRC
jgi:ribonuclease-3